MITPASAPGLQAGKMTPGTRVRSIDLLRGVVMILMAIDHVRVYSGIPAGGHTPGIFFTRWITHFCVPAFVFFAGTSAFFYGSKINDKHRLARYLLVRGLLLVLLELTLIRFCWTFNLDYTHFMLAGVIWMLGCCMVLMAACVRLNTLTIGITGLAILFFQQAFQYLPQALPKGWQAYFGWFWEFIYPSGLDRLPGISILYVLVPWIGVMMAGYGFGKILLLEPAKRKRLCIQVGVSAIVLFLIAASIQIAMDKSYKGDLPFIFRMLNQQKYPASQLYLLMTLGPLIALVPFAEQATGKIADVFLYFGRVPLFYYLLHIPLIHIAALMTNFLREGSAHQEWYGTAPFTEIEVEHRWGLPLLYLVFIIVEVILYFACRSYAKYKALHPEKKWLKFI
jgi:uncharacterized membrane protein